MTIRHIPRIINTVLFVLVMIPNLYAAPVTIPPALSPGDSYRLIFTSSQLRDGISSDINVYNIFVQTVADAVPELSELGTTWRVIGSTASVNAIDNTATTGVGVPVYRLDGVRVADNYTDLWDSSIDNLLNVDETGAPYSGSTGNVFTGTYAAGTGVPGETLGTAVPIVGAIWDVNSGWVKAGGAPATSERTFYAMSGELNTPPELIFKGGFE